MYSKSSVLVIMQEPFKIISWVKEALQKYEDIKVYTAATGLTGFAKFNEYLPVLVIVENDLPDMSGMSFSAILKDTDRGFNCTIYVLGVTSFMQNAKADYYFPTELNKDIFSMQIRTFFDRQYMRSHHSDEFERAKMRQNEFLPAYLETSTFKVDTIYSPFSELSGDGIDYWYGEDKEGLYGLLFDCTGHDIVSFTQVGEIRALLKRGCKYFQLGTISSLGEILKNANEDLFALHGDDTTPTAAILFFFDFKKNVLHYCSAGIPNFFIRHENSDAMNEILMENYLIGYEENVIFEEKELSLEGIDEIVFSSDGLSELMFKENIDNAKHDDVSAILIKILKCNVGKTDVHYEHLSERKVIS
ncbi:MAG: nifL [Firmicutes bacterium]|nr:nifL [Bacillota bacterium]